MEIRDSIVVVTGAGRGAGRAIALEFARNGARVALVARSEGDIQSAAQEAVDLGVEALAVPADVTDESQVARMAEAVLARFGGIDVLVNNAGIGHRGPVETTRLEDWNRVLAVNATGPFLCARAFIPALKTRGRGHIVNIGSGASRQGYANLATYCASKFALFGLSQSLAAELGEFNIKVTTLLPGSISTGFSGRKPGERPPGVKLLRPEDVAEAIVSMVRQSDYAWTQEMHLWPFLSPM